MQAASGTWVGRSCASHLPGVCASVCVSGAFEEEGARGLRRRRRGGVFPQKGGAAEGVPWQRQS